MSSINPQDRRGSYRLRFPVRERPRLLGEGMAWAVYDCSESGVRCLVPGDAAAPDIGATVEGTLRFSRGEEVPIVGVVVWAQPGHVGLTLDPRHAVPFRILLAEQRHIHATYPDFPL
ncbi:MAG TPA: PilZ domain-containing protein [Longimicrobiales bacterium]|nr:PilZ domain-containing protein [Longimicrobiales bacterium]